jgi:hypothetical protein
MGFCAALMAGALLLCAWLNAIPPGSPKPPLAAPGARLGELLAATNPAYPSAPSPAGGGGGVVDERVCVRGGCLKKGFAFQWVVRCSFNHFFSGLKSSNHGFIHYGT